MKLKRTNPKNLLTSAITWLLVCITSPPSLDDSKNPRTSPPLENWVDFPLKNQERSHLKNGPKTLFYRARNGEN